MGIASESGAGKGLGMMEEWSERGGKQLLCRDGGRRGNGRAAADGEGEGLGSIDSKSYPPTTLPLPSPYFFCFRGRNTHSLHPPLHPPLHPSLSPFPSHPSPSHLSPPTPSPSFGLSLRRTRCPSRMIINQANESVSEFL